MGVEQGLLEQWAGTREFHSNKNKVETTRATCRSKDQLCLGLSKMACLTKVGLYSPRLVLEKMIYTSVCYPVHWSVLTVTSYSLAGLEQNLKVILSEFPPQFTFFILIIYHKQEKKKSVFLLIDTI